MKLVPPHLEFFDTACFSLRVFMVAVFTLKPGIFQAPFPPSRSYVLIICASSLLNKSSQQRVYMTIRCDTIFFLLVVANFVSF